MMMKETQCSHCGKCPRSLPKRRRPWVSAILLFAASSSAFTSIPSSTTRSTVQVGPSSLLWAAPSQLAPFDTQQSTSLLSSPDHHSVAHLSNTEQRKLLDHVMEMRRIQQLEPTTCRTSLQWSRAAGYGDDVWALEDAIAAGEAAREQLITSNMGLVRYVVKGILQRRRRLQSLTREDLCQEGVLGLVRAMDRWDPTIRTAKFSTYAVYWIRAVVLRYIAEKDSVIRVPCYVSSTVSKVTRAARTMGWTTNGDDWAWKEAADAKALAEAAGVSDKQLKEAVKVKNRQILSFDTWAEIEKATVCNEESEDMEFTDSSHTKEALSKFLGPREVEAISWRYGLNNDGDAVGGFAGGRWGEAMSFAQVGKQMKVSAEYGRRLCNRAMDKLRAAAEDGSLQPALLSL